LAVTNNQDTGKVLSTVALTLYAFTEKYSNAFVIAEGSTDARTRLYRRGISNNLLAIEQNFNVFGLTHQGWESFCKDMPCRAFMVRRK
jgi:hypothetical protein